MNVLSKTDVTMIERVEGSGGDILGVNIDNDVHFMM